MTPTLTFILICGFALPIFVLILSTYRDHKRKEMALQRACKEDERRKRERERKAAAAKEAQYRRYWEAEAQKADKAAQKAAERAAKDAAQKAERFEKEKRMTAHQRMIAKERRLMTDSLRYDILKRDGFRCCLCGLSAQQGVVLHVDHIFPVSKGGKTEPSNLRTLCERCNLGKRDKIEDDSNPDFSFETTHDYTSSAFVEELTKREMEYTIRQTARGQSVWIRFDSEQETFITNSTVNGETIAKAQTTQFFEQGEWYVRI